MTQSARLPDGGVVRIRPIDASQTPPRTTSEYEDWGPKDPAAADLHIDRWLIEVADGEQTEIVGDLSAHDVWHGPTPGSRARNIGISVSEGARGRGIGAAAQHLLAELLHDAGILRVEASTDVSNVAEQRALAKAGFRLEGVLRSAQERRDGQHDLQLWSHVRSAPGGALPTTLDVGDLALRYPWPHSGPWLRTMFLHTLDGAVVGSDGRSRSISGPADHAVMAEVRRLSDVILIGAGTLRAERYTPLRARPDAVDERRALGLQDAPVLAIVSGSLDLPFDDEVFRESAQRPLVITSQAADPDAVRVAREHADVIALPGSEPDVADIVAALNERGLHRVVCEGGPRLAAQLGRAHLIDEVDLSLGDVVTGGGQVSTGSAAPDPEAFELRHVLYADGYVFTRYVRRMAS